MVVESKTFRLVETRCDRCKALISSTKVEEGSGNIIHDNSKKSKNRRFNLDAFSVCCGQRVIIEYERLCSSCSNHMDTLIKKMRPVNRVAGRGRKPTLKTGKKNDR
jgi:hypothetical protein